MIKDISIFFVRKSFLLIAFFAFLITTSVKSQTDFNVGTGTTGNDGLTYPCPLQDFYEGSRMQFLYKASELSALGMGSGNILSLKYNVTALNGFGGDIPQLTIKIGQVSTTTLSATTWEATTATVFGPVNYVPTLGVNIFNFSV